jgi:hypothetical protein
MDPAMARYARQRRCREAPPIAVGPDESLFVDAAGQLLACGRDGAVGHGDSEFVYDPTPVAGMAGIRVQIVAAGGGHNLALIWDGRVYSWGSNYYGELGHGDTEDRREPALVEGLEGVCSIAAGSCHSRAPTESGAVFGWGMALEPDEETETHRRPIVVEGFEGVRVRSCLLVSALFRLRPSTRLPSARPGSSSRGGLAAPRVSAAATRKANPRISALRRCGAFG